MGITDFVSEIKREEKYPNFEKSVRAVQHDLLGFMAKNIDGESTAANELTGSYILYKWAPCLNNSKC